MKQSKSNKIIIIILSIIVVLIMFILLLTANMIRIKKDEDNKLNEIKQYTSVKDFKNIEEVTKYLECTYIKRENSTDNNYDIDIYMKIKLLPYTNEVSNRGFYDKLISYSVSALDFRNFRIIDKENDIIIEVICDKESETIKTTKINGETNYFAKRESQLEIKNYKQVTETNFIIQSEIINKLINNNWRITDSEIGTKESTFNSYDIYFDEGIEVRKVNNQVFNIVFTDKYKLNVINNLTTNTSKEEIVKVLGNPTFEDTSTGVFGYKGKDIYVFFNKNQKQISVYKVENKDNLNSFINAIEKFLDNNNKNDLLNTLRENYKEYDKYSSNDFFTELVYSSIGIKVQFGDNVRNGIIFYNNYNGNITNDLNIQQIVNEEVNLPNNIYIENEDLIFTAEKNKTQEIQDMIFNALSDESRASEIQTSTKFYTIKNYLSNNTYSIKFISVDSEEPNSELKDNISSYIWIDDYNFIYSIQNTGIYLYNTKKRMYAKIITGNEKFEIKEYNNFVLKYDDKIINLK